MADLKPHGPLIGWSEPIEASPADLVTVVKEFGFEGVVAKRKGSCYEPGKRTGAWLKYKVNKGSAAIRRAIRWTR